MCVKTKIALSLLGIFLLWTALVFWPEKQTGFQPHSAAAQSSATSHPAQNKRPAAVEMLARQPLSFEASQATTGDQTDFTARGKGYRLFLSATEATLVLQPSQPSGAKRQFSKRVNESALRENVLRMHLAGAKADAHPQAERRLPGEVNYLLGTDQSQWRTALPLFGKVRYQDIYPGVDVVYYGQQNQLEYDFEVAPGADPRAIRLEFAGAERLEINAAGELVLAVGGESIKFQQPVIYQEAGGQRLPVSGGFTRLDGDAVGFELGAYDASRPLVIDPVLVYADYLGGTHYDYANAIASDNDGSAYIVGEAWSIDFPVVNWIHPYNNAIGGGEPVDIFITKFNADGTLAFSTYFGGPKWDVAYGIAVDQTSRKIYITGYNNGGLFPRINEYVPPGGIYAGGTAAFVTCFASSGRFVDYSTLLASGGDDFGRGIAVRNDVVTVVGSAGGNGFPLQNAYQTYQGREDGFITRLSFNSMTNTLSLVYSTYLGGDADDRLNGVAVDTAGNAYAGGFARSVMSMIGPQLSGGNALLGRFSPTGTLEFLSRYGGNGTRNDITGVAVDLNNNVYITGFAGFSAAFPLINNFQPGYGGGEFDAFVAKVRTDGGGIQYSSYLGSVRKDQGKGIVVNPQNVAFVTGTTYSDVEFPATVGQLGTPTTSNAGDELYPDAFLSVINPTGRTLIYSTRYGGSQTANGGAGDKGGFGEDFGEGVAVSGDSVYVCGYTTSANLPVVNPYPGFPGVVPPRRYPFNYPGGGFYNNQYDKYDDGFVFRLRFQADVQVTKTILTPAIPPPLPLLSDITFRIEVHNNGPDQHPGVIVTDALSGSLAYESYTAPPGWQAAVLPSGALSFTNSMAVGETAVFTVTARYKCPNFGPDIDAPPSTLANSASVNAGSYDPNGLNNSSIVSFAVANNPPGPLALGCADIEVNAPVGSCMAKAPAPGLDFSCYIVTCNPPLGTGAGGTNFTVGTTPVTCSASDGLGGTQMCSFNVIVRDREGPTFTAIPTALASSTNPGACTATVNYAPTASDNCAGVPLIDCTPPTGSTFPVGITVVNCTATDANGNQTTRSFPVTVSEFANEAPVITACPGNQVVNSTPGLCGANVNFAATATDNCPAGLVLLYSHQPGSYFPVGTTNVTVQARDKNGNLSANNCTFTVTVNDREAPRFIPAPPPNLTADAEPNRCDAIVNFDPLAVDNCPDPAMVNCVPPTGTRFNKGVTAVNCTARDAANNTATASFTVTVSDRQPPTIICPPNQTVDGTTLAGGIVNYPAPTVSDNCLPLGAPVCNPPSGSAFPVGMTTVNCSVTDAAGLTAACSFKVTVVCPAITLSPATLPNGIQGIAYAQTLTVMPAGPYSFALATGILPPGLMLNSNTGVIAGVPSAPGNYAFSVRVSAGVCAKTQNYNLVITGTCAALTINPANLPGGTVGAAYDQTLTATGGAPPYTFALTQGALPLGLSLQANGALTGTALQAGTFSFRVTATGQGGCTGSRSYVLTIACTGITFSPAGPALPNGMTYVAYTQPITVTPPANYFYTIHLGQLPHGFTLNSTSGVISGITDQTGLFTFTIKVVAGNCQTTKAYSILIVSRAAQAQLNDYDGDGKADLALFTANGAWHIQRSSDQQAQTVFWGTVGDVPVSGDYDGDGKTDIAVFRPRDGTWYVKKSSNGGVLMKAWGLSTDVPVPGDYDGDGRTDIAVWRGSTGTWYVVRSSDGQYAMQAWGSAAAPYQDVPVTGDYDGDGKTDLAVFRRVTGAWLVKHSSDGQYMVKQWGVGTDIPLAADYDGDGKTDLAVWRGAAGTWYIWQSATNQSRLVPWGTADDRADAGDYDGDGKADLAVWRRSESVWYLRLSQSAADQTRRIVMPGVFGVQFVNIPSRWR